MSTYKIPGDNPGTPVELGSETVNSEQLSRIVVVDGAARPTFAPVQDRQSIADFTATSGWAVLGTDTTTLATSTNHVLDDKSLSFAKFDGAQNGTVAGIERTITSVDLSRFNANSVIEIAVNLTSVANVASAFVRLGTDSSNYNTWLVADASITAGKWNLGRVEVGASEDSTGDGWDMSAITYIAVGTNHDAETDALAAILFDHVAVVGAQMTVT